MFAQLRTGLKRIGAINIILSRLFVFRQWVKFYGSVPPVSFQAPKHHLFSDTELSLCFCPNCLFLVKWIKFMVLSHLFVFRQWIKFMVLSHLFSDNTLSLCFCPICLFLVKWIKFMVLSQLFVFRQWIKFMVLSHLFVFRQCQWIKLMGLSCLFVFRQWIKLMGLSHLFGFKRWSWWFCSTCVFSGSEACSSDPPVCFRAGKLMVLCPTCVFSGTRRHGVLAACQEAGLWHLLHAGGKGARTVCQNDRQEERVTRGSLSGHVES